MSLTAFLRKFISEIPQNCQSRRRIGEGSRRNRSSDTSARLESLEDRTLLAAVGWDGEASDLQWNNPLNWDGDVLPGAADDVFISEAANVTIQHVSANTSVRSVSSTASLQLVSGSLTVSGASEIQGTFTTGTNATLSSNGLGAVFRVTGPVSLGVSNLLATNGGVIDLPNATSYSGGGDGITSLKAIGSDSQLLLAGITSLTGFGRHGYVILEARSGGVVDLSSVTQIPGGTTQISAFDSGSEINLSSLETWTDANFSQSSSITWGNGGNIRVDSLQTLTTVGITASTGDTLVFPSLTHIGGVGDSSAVLRAQGSGSRIELPVLATMDGSDRHGHVRVEARSGGVIDMPVLTAILEGTTQISAFDSGSEINLSALETWTDANFSQSSSITWGNGGNIRVDSLQTLTTVGITASTGDTLVFPSLTHIGGVGDSSAVLRAEGSGSRIELPVLATMDGSDRHGHVRIEARTGGVIDMPVLTAILEGTIQISAFDSGSEINVSSLETWTDNNFSQFSSVTWGDGGRVRVDNLREIISVSITAIDGQILTFPALERIGGVGDSSATILADGNGSRIEFPAVVVIDGPERHGDVSFQAKNGGVIDLPVVLEVEHGSVNISAFDSDGVGGGSFINMPAIQTWNNTNQFRDSYIQYGRGADINLNSLTVATGVSIYATDGDTITLPALTTYYRTARSGPVLSAIGTGSRLELPQLTTITGNIITGLLHVTANTGGTISMPALSVISQGSSWFYASGSDSRIEMPSLQSWTISGGQSYPNLARAVDNAVLVLGQSTSVSSIYVEAYEGGEIHGGVLTLSGGALLSGDSVVRADVVNISGGVGPGIFLPTRHFAAVPVSTSQFGTLTIDGDLENTTSGNVSIQLGGTIAGTQHDRLSVTGQAALAGNLNVSLLNFTPSTGEHFQILNFASRDCDFELKSGLDLGNGLYLAAAFDLDSMTLNAGSTPDSGQQCQTIPVFTNVDVGPNPAKAADVLSITFEVDVPLLTTPTVTVDGNAAFMAAQNGSFYTFSYVVAGTETEGSIDVVMTATSLDGGIGQTSVVTTLDFTDPVVTNITPDQFSVEVGSVLTVTFDSSEALSNTSVVRIGGQPATRNNVPGYSYSRLLTGDEGLGLVTVEVTAVDIAGNSGVATGQVQIFTNSGTVIVEPDDRGQLITGGIGTNDLVQIVVSLAEAINPAVEADFIAYQVHLDNGLANSTFHLNTLGISLTGFEGFERLLQHGTFRGLYENVIVGTNYSENLTGTSAADLIVGQGGNDTILGHGGNDIIIGGTGDDSVDGGDDDDVFLYSGTSNGFDSITVGTGTDQVIAVTAGTVIGVNGYDNGVEEFAGLGDTIIRDTNYSRTLNFSDTILTAITEVDAAGGNDTVTASNLSAGVYRGATGDDVLIAGSTSVTWLYSGSNGGFDTLQNGSGLSVAVAETAGTVIGVNGYDNAVEEFTGLGDTVIRDTNYSRTLNFSNTTLTGIAEVDAAGGNDTVTASNLSAGVYRGGTGDDVLIAGSTAVTWLYSGSNGGFDTLQNGSGLSVAVAETAGTVIGVNGYDNGVEEFTGLGDTIIRDTNYSRTLNFSDTILTAITEVDAAGGNDTVTASNLSSGVYRGGTGDDVLIAGSTAVTWLYSGSNGGFDTLQNGSGLSVAVAETAGTVIGVNGYDNGVEEFTGLGDTVIRDTNYSRTLNFSNTVLFGIAEVDAAGGNDTIVASTLSGANYRLGSGYDWLVVASANSAVEIVVADFNPSGIDRIDLQILSLPIGFQDLQFAQQGATTEVAAPGLNLRLLDILFTELDEEDFLFS